MYKFTYRYTFLNLLGDIFTGRWGGIANKLKQSGNEYYAWHTHLSSIDAKIKVGAKVEEGQIIGKTGASGNASELPAGEEHLHFGISTKAPLPKGVTGRDVKSGVWVDPSQFFQGLELNPRDNRNRQNPDPD